LIFCKIKICTLTQINIYKQAQHLHNPQRNHFNLQLEIRIFIKHFSASSVSLLRYAFLWRRPVGRMMVLSLYKFRKAISVILLTYSANIRIYIYIYIYVIMKKYPVLKL
jgi:hypothetical protein